MSHRLKIALWATGSTFAIIVAALAATSMFISRHARDWVDDWLTQKFKSEVDLESFQVSAVFPLVQVEGRKLALHFQNRGDLPPLIAIKHFTMKASAWGFLRNPRRVQFVHLDGLELNIPPRTKSEPAPDGIRQAMGKFHDVRFVEIVSENATLRILTNKPGKDPLEFDIEKLYLSSSTTDGALTFRATLTNPKPPGEILSDGSFGPWNGDVPRQTPVQGSYTLDGADLSVFRGISGILSSNGNYKGTIEEIHVNGTTNVPDFQVTRAGHPVALTTTFDATVDGTNGDTYLHPVVAHFRKSTIVAQGSVEGTTGIRGKTITLDVTGDHADIADLLQLAIKGPATMTGPIRLKTKFVLKPGPQEIPDRLFLDGIFNLNSVHFTSGSVQQKLDNMSKRSLGKPEEVEGVNDGDASDDVASAMKGNFHLGNGSLTVKKVEFQIPGVNVHIGGTYDMRREVLDFHGTVELQAKLSQTMTGAKSFFLKLLDPFFSQNGNGTELPIKITGPIQHPSYGLNFRHNREIDRANK